MYLAERYIVSHVVKPMLGSLAIGITTLLAIRFTMALEFGLSDNDSFKVIARTLVYWLPFYIGLAIPISLFAGLMLGFDRMAKGNEIVVLLACGGTPFSLVRSVFVVTAVATALGVFVYGWLDPLTTYARRAFNHKVQYEAVYLAFQKNTFFKFKNSTILLGDFDSKTGRLEKVFVYRVKKDGKTETLTAPRGRIVLDENNPRPTVFLEDVDTVTTKTDKKSGETTFDAANSARFSAPVGPVIKPFRKRGFDQKEWTFPELVEANLKGVAPIRFQKVKTELHYRLTQVVFVIFLPMLALVFSDIFNRRRPSLRFGLGGLAVIGIYELLVNGRFAANFYSVTPFLTLWLPLLIVVGAVATRGYQVLSRPEKVV